MILLTDDLRDRLLANGRQPDTDHVPVVKFFNPIGVGTWLATELDTDGDTLFGHADLGFGSPELGSFSLSELTSVRLHFGMGIEHDICSKPRSRCQSMPRPRDRPRASWKASACSGLPQRPCGNAGDIPPIGASPPLHRRRESERAAPFS